MLFCVLLALTFVSSTTAQTAEEKVSIDVDRFWDVVEKSGRIYVQPNNLYNYFMTFEKDIITKYGINETEFAAGFVRSVGTSRINARAYFKLFDIYQEYEHEMELLNYQDCAALVQRFDGTGDLSLNEEEFKRGFRTHLTGVPIAAIFVTYRDIAGTGFYDDYVTYNAWWEGIAQDIDRNDDNKLTYEEVEAFFLSRFGRKAWGTNLVDTLDICNDGFIREDEWDILYFILDTIVLDGALMFREFYQMVVLAPYTDFHYMEALLAILRRKITDVIDC